ncbi:MAG: hypothetical protein OXE40_05760 [Gammaproteobacteria bacterium]|nr:hypothetical protein [Gammaproteobacteria bacterium]
MLDELGEDHKSWLLVAAHNYLGQRQAEKAIVLLELLELLEPHDPQCRKMLAYSYLLQGDRRRCATLVEEILAEPLGEADRAAMEMMSRRLGSDGAGAGALPSGLMSNSPATGAAPP